MHLRLPTGGKLFLFGIGKKYEHDKLMRACIAKMKRLTHISKEVAVNIKNTVVGQA